jgi:hypothetical protein
MLKQEIEKIEEIELNEGNDGNEEDKNPDEPPKPDEENLVDIFQLAEMFGVGKPLVTADINNKKIKAKVTIEKFKEFYNL